MTRLFAYQAAPESLLRPFANAPATPIDPDLEED